MRNSDDQRKFTIICRMFVLLFVPVSVACAISFFFTGDLFFAFLAILAIPIVLLPDILDKFIHLKKSYRLNLIYFAMILICYYGDIVFGLERYIPGYDVLCYAVMSIFIINSVSATLQILFVPLRARNKLPVLCLISAVTAVFCTSIFEAFELLFMYIIGHPISVTRIIVHIAVIIITSFGFITLLQLFLQTPVCNFFVKAVRVFVLRNTQNKAESSIQITSIQNSDK